jgi:hypothetical protein
MSYDFVLKVQYGQDGSDPKEIIPKEIIQLTNMFAT